MATNYKIEKNAQAREKSMQLLEQLPRFCTSYVISIERSVAPLTILAYLQRLVIFFKYLHEDNSYFRNKNITDFTIDDICKLDIDDINQFAHWIYMNNNNDSKKGNKTSTVDNYLSALCSLWDYFIMQKGTKFNPVTQVKRAKKQKKEVIRLEENEKAGFLRSLENGEGFDVNQLKWNEKTRIRDIAICKILLGTGIRVSELVGLDVDDLNFQDCCFKVVRKRDKFDSVYFSDEIKDALIEYLDERGPYYQPVDDEPALFLVGIGKYKGTRLSVRSVEHIVKKFAVAGVPLKGSSITPHKLRATFGTDLLKETGNLDLVREELGHTDPKTTLNYTVTEESTKRAARNLLQSRDIYGEPDTSTDTIPKGVYNTFPTN